MHKPKVIPQRSKKAGSVYIAVVRLPNGKYMAMLDENSCLRTWQFAGKADEALREHPYYKFGFSYYEVM